jgi:thymidine phosphorylase
MLARALIERKRDGGRIAPDEWRQLMNAYAADGVPDYQMAALAMAIFFQGLDRAETVALTDAMLHSGAMLDLSHLPAQRVDKHSTGGVGDKVSLILAPLVASLGVAVPMMSGSWVGSHRWYARQARFDPRFSQRLVTGARDRVAGAHRVRADRADR